MIFDIWILNTITPPVTEAHIQVALKMKNMIHKTTKHIRKNDVTFLFYFHYSLLCQFWQFLHFTRRYENSRDFLENIYQMSSFHLTL